MKRNGRVQMERDAHLERRNVEEEKSLYVEGSDVKRQVFERWCEGW